MDLDQYVWTGTDLVRREDLDRQPGDNGPTGDDDRVGEDAQPTSGEPGAGPDRPQGS